MCYNEARMSLISIKTSLNVLHEHRRKILSYNTIHKIIVNV